MIDFVESLLDNYAAGRISRREAGRALMGLMLAPMGVSVAGVAGAAGAATSIAEAGNSTSAASSPGAESTFRATGLNHLALRVTDVARSRDFYRERFGATIIQDNAPGNCFLRVGSNYIGLFRSSEPGMDHFCLTVEGYEAGEAVRQLEEAGHSPRMQEDRVYFDDPDGLEIQLDSRFGSWPGPLPPGIE